MRQRPCKRLIFRVGTCPHLLEPIYEPRPRKVGCSKLKYQRLAVAPSQRRFALARIIVCCGASIVAHFARKVRATNT